MSEEGAAPVRGRAPHRIAFWTVAALLAAMMLGLAVRQPGINDYYRARFGDMVYGRAYRPYVSRVLVPLLVRGAAAVVPLAQRQALSEYGRTEPWLRDTLDGLGWEPEYLTEYLVALVLMYGALLGFVASVRALFGELYQAPGWFGDVVSLATLLTLGLGFEYATYIYDFTTVFLFTLGLLLLVHRRWGLFVAVFMVACLNKETAILLTAVFAIHFFRRRDIARRQFRGLLAVQAGVWLVSRSALAWIFHTNPGGTVELHLSDNLWLLHHRFVHIALLLVAIVALTGYRWHEKPEFLRDALWIAALLAPLAVFLGLLDELRAWYEVFPIVALLVAHTAGGLFGVKITTREPLRQIQSQA
ncbi:MAG: hypothetical protein J7M38_04810 [Armatimonadetes bacterium]|nr:hypothetical protein [Armatimonadota bacterium]